MFEFSNKELKNKFKETIYGKKLNKILYISLSIALLLLMLSLFLFYLFDNLNDIEKIILSILFGITSISFIIACYLDGKRDGAIEQFKLQIKK